MTLKDLIRTLIRDLIKETNIKLVINEITKLKSPTTIFQIKNYPSFNIYCNQRYIVLPNKKEPIDIYDPNSIPLVRTLLLDCIKTVRGI